MLALLFPGQGSQEVGMGRDACEVSPAARAVFDAGPPDPFFNVNTPDELAEADRIARAA